jgi:DNA replication and repair protein RecF
MHLKSLKLENFRNYKDLSIEFEKDQITVLVGKNAQGKTNLLESIYSLALTKSFRSKKNFEQICWDREHSRIKAEVENSDGEQLLEIFCSKAPMCQKVLKLNESKVKSVEFVGNLNIVIFTPDDLNLISLSPNIRRKYLNMAISQVSKNYLQNLIEYTKVIKQRNALLFRIKERKAKKEELVFWDNALVNHGSKIIMERQKTVDFLNEKLTENYRKIAGTEEDIKIKYNSNVEKDFFTEKLASRLQKDIDYAATSVGPHLDDFAFFLNERNIEEFGSRGEYRSAILSLKLAEIEFIKEKTGEFPVLLLDDVFSELDEIRQEKFLKSIQNCQTIITTTHEHEGFKNQLENAKIRYIESGQVKN